MGAENLTGSVDVLIAAWNREDTVERAMLSALNEPEVGKVIVIDDGSTDSTLAIAQRVAFEFGERVVVRRLENDIGPAAARNLGLELATAPWVAVLDADDFFLRGRLRYLFLHTDDYDFVADNLLQVREGDAIAQSVMQEKSDMLQPLNLEEFVLGNVSRPGHDRKELGFLKPLMRRSFLDHHGLRYDESLRLGEDYVLYARALALRARFVVTPATGYVSVVRPDSISGKHSLGDLERLRDADLGLRSIVRLTARERRAIDRHYRSVDARAQWVAVIEAVKARSVSSFVAPFFRSLTVTSFLIRNLIKQASLRSGRLLASLVRRASNALAQASRRHKS